MPPLPLALTFRALLPGLSPLTDAVVGALVAANGEAINAQAMTRRVGLQSRFQLNRRLRQDGLPGFGELADWISVLALMWHAEASGESLLSVATKAGVEPATCYRRCRRTLGVAWRVARGRGFAWGLTLFLKRCARHPPRSHPPTLTSFRPYRMGALDSREASPRRSDGGLRHPQGVLAFRIPVSDAPTDVVADHAGAIYATRAYAASVATIDLELRRSTGSIPVGSNPTRLCIGPGGLLFVTNQFGDSISVIDRQSHDHLVDIPVPGDPAPLTVSPDGRTLYVATNHDRLYAVSVVTRRIIRDLPLPATSHHLTMHPRAVSLFVSTRTAGTIIEVSLPALRPRRTFETGGQPQALVVARDGSELFVADEAGAVHVVNLERGSLAATLHLAGGAYGMDLTPDGDHLYVAMPAEGLVHVFDRITRRMVGTIVTQGCPRHTAFTAQGGTGLIVNEAGWIDVIW